MEAARWKKIRARSRLEMIHGLLRSLWSKLNRYKDRGGSSNPKRRSSMPNSSNLITCVLPNVNLSSRRAAPQKVLAKLRPHPASSLTCSLLNTTSQPIHNKHNNKRRIQFASRLYYLGFLLFPRQRGFSTKPPR